MAVKDLVRFRKAVAVQDQADDDLLTVGSVIARVPAPGLRVVRALALEVGGRQVVEVDRVVEVEQRVLARGQRLFDRRAVRMQPIEVAGEARGYSSLLSARRTRPGSKPALRVAIVWALTCRPRASRPYPLAFDGRLQSTQPRQLSRSTGLTADPLSLIGGIVVGMERNQSKKVTIPKRDRANSLTESKRIHLCSVGCFEVLDEFPLKTCMPIQRVPVQLPQPPQRSNDLLEVDDLKAEEHILKLGAIEI